MEFYGEDENDTSPTLLHAKPLGGMNSCACVQDLVGYYAYE